MNHNGISHRTNLVLHILFAAIALTCVVPLVLIVSVSLTDEQAILKDGYRFIPEVFSLDAYRFVSEMHEKILRAYGVTLFVAAVGTALVLLVNALYAYPLIRQEVRWRKTLMFLLFFTMLFSGGLVSWYLVCTQLLQLKDTVWALILPSVMNPFYVIVLRTFFNTTLPAEVIDSGRIDGAGEWRIFVQIVLPLSLPALATIAIFSSVGFWNDYYLPLMFINDPKLFNLQTLIYRILENIKFLTENTNVAGLNGIYAVLPQEGARMALVIVTLGPVVLAYPFFQKYFIRGLTLGSIKG